jgi:hemolysin activation/secretion protein
MPFWIGPQSHWGVELSYGYEDNTSSFGGLDFADVNLQELVVLASYQRLLPTYSVAARVGFKSGSAESSEVTETEGDYMMLFGSVSYAKEFSETAVLSADMNFQLALDENLPAARLFNAGGALSLRGYPNAVRSGDSGLIVRVQVSPKRTYDMPGYEPGLLSPFGFVDLGMVVPFREDGSIDADQDYLASLGLGLRGEFSKSASGVMMIAIPMVDTLGFGDSGSPIGYIGLDYKF